jgi:hypothetical protein
VLEVVFRRGMGNGFEPYKHPRRDERDAYDLLENGR